MKKQITIKSDVSDVRASLPIAPKNLDEDWGWENLEDMDAEEIRALATKLKVNENVLHGFVSVVSDLRETIHQDLEDMWKRIDEIEKAMQG